MFDLEISFTVDKKALGPIIAKSINKHGLADTAELLDYIKATGFKYSTKGAITVSVSDVKVPEAKKAILAEADKQVEKIAEEIKETVKQKVDEEIKEKVLSPEEIILQLEKELSAKAIGE
jgi:DNA-directed RNA polymerase subunit beta'